MSVLDLPPDNGSSAIDGDELDGPMDIINFAMYRHPDDAWMFTVPATSPDEPLVINLHGSTSAEMSGRHIRSAISFFFDLAPFSFGWFEADEKVLDREVRELSLALNQGLGT